MAIFDLPAPMSLEDSTAQQQAGQNDFGIGRESNTFAAQTQAAMTRANWARSRGQLRPLIDRLNYSYFNPTGRLEATQGAGTLAVDGVRQAQQQFGRDARSVGLSLAGDQQTEVQRQFDVAANTSKLDAMNRASRGFDDRKNQIALG